jgi:hypothetical protein
VAPDPVEITYPLLLPDRPAAVLKAYPVETVIAEKFEAMVSLGLANTRLKDFYDMWCIAQTFELQHAVASIAVHNTFARRRALLPDGVPVGLTDVFVAARTIPGGHSSPGTRHRVCRQNWPKSLDLAGGRRAMAAMGKADG